MIVHPRIGQLVQLWYRQRENVSPFHGELGRVVIRSSGPGPRNHGVKLLGDTLAVVPCGNLRKVEER